MVLGLQLSLTAGLRVGSGLRLEVLRLVDWLSRLVSGMAGVDVRQTSSRCRERSVVRGRIVYDKGLRPTRRGEYVDHCRARGRRLVSGSFSWANWGRSVWSRKRLLGLLR